MDGTSDKAKRCQPSIKGQTMRVSTAYFAGAGTIIVAIAGGLGGGLVIADAVNPLGTRQPGKVELQVRAQQSPQPNAAQSSEQPIFGAIASNKPQAPVPYVAQVQPAADKPALVGAALPTLSQNETPGVVAPASTASDPRPGENNVAATKPHESPQEGQQVQQPGAREETSAREDAYVRGHGADPRRQADKRKAERRHQQWTARHWQRRDQELLNVEEAVREETGSRQVIMRPGDEDRPNFGRPAAVDFPRNDFLDPD